MCLLIVGVERSSPWQHASIHPGLVYLLLIPSLYSLFFNDLLVLFHFLGTLYKFYTLRNIILPEAICCCLHTCYLGIVLCNSMYIRQLSLPTVANNINIMGQLYAFLKESCLVNVVLLVILYCRLSLSQVLI